MKNFSIITIPLNPPLIKGDSTRPSPLKKGVRGIYESLISILFLLFTSSPSNPNLLPRVSLNPSGSLYFGKYTGHSERYNLDVGVDILVSLLSWETTDFYIEYVSNLEMAKQVGNVTFDPRYAHYFIIGGFSSRQKGYYLKSYIVHDCKHIIDFPPDSNKIVFNRLKFSISRNLPDFKERFQTRLVEGKRSRKPRWEFIYGFYPQSKVIDYLNSRPYYKHDFELRLEFPLFFFPRGETFLGIKGRYVISANNPPRYYRELSFIVESNIFNEKGALSFYIENIPISEDPLKSPEGFSLIGMRYLF